MKRHHILWLSGCILLFLACENEIGLDFEGRAPKLIMTAMINNNNEENYLYLNMTGPYATAHVEEATVEIQVNGRLVETPERAQPVHESDYQLRFPIHSRFQPGDVVRIDAHTPDGKHHAWAEVTVPQPATIVKVDTMSTRKLVPNIMYGGSQLMDLMRHKITIKDRPQERNYYRLVVATFDTVAIYIPDSLKTDVYTYKNYSINTDEDMILTDGHPQRSDDELFTQPKNIYSVFDDHLFRDKDCTLTAYSVMIKTGRNAWYNWISDYTVDYLWVHSRIEIQLQSITEAEFRYLKILNVLDSNAYDEVLNEPITFPSNVNGGTGFVSISSSTSVTLYRKSSIIN